MTQNSPVNCKLMHFLLWIKGSPESPNFETFECSGENLPNSLCHFLNHKSVFLQFCIISVMKYTLHEKDQSKCKFLRLLSPRIKIYQILVIFEITNWFFFKFGITLQCHGTKLLCPLLAEILCSFNEKSLPKYKFGEISFEKSKFEILHFDGLLLSKSYKVSVKKVQKIYLS